MKFVFLIFISMLIIGGCASSGGGSKNYFAEHKSNLLETLGQPHTTQPDGNGGEVWTYLVKQEILMQAKNQGLADEYGLSNSEFNVPEIHTTTVAQKFYISNQGYIYKVQ
ncbi:MAG: hypothetical protein AAF571_14900 [Verrucomicrobiota bacterium]